MSATMALQGGRAQLEQSDMRRAFNMGKTAKDGISRTTIEEMNHPIKKPRADVREEKKWGVESPGYKKVKAAIERHLGMLRHNKTSGYLPCQNGTGKNPHTRWRCKETGAPPPTRGRVRSAELTPPPPGKPPAPTGNISGAQPSEIINLPA